VEVGVELGHDSITSTTTAILLAAVAELVREAIRDKYLRASASGPVALWDGPFAGSSRDHDSAFDEP